MRPITLKAKEAAQYLGCSYWKLLDMAKKSEIPHIRVGKLVFFRKETLDQWLGEQEMRSMEK